jgi:hypothetical protein
VEVVVVVVLEEEVVAAAVGAGKLSILGFLAI